MNLSDIYKKYGSMVFNLALQYTQNVQDAEEVTQDVFVLVHTKMDGFNQESDLKTWVYRITINKSLDYLRAKKAIKRWSFFSANRIGDHELEIPDTGLSHPGIQLEQKEVTEKLFSLINKLPESQKTVILLLKIEGLSLKEVAEIMGLTYKAVESKLHRAKKNLKQLIEKSKEN